jgi:hypothetical protein
VLVVGPYALPAVPDEAALAVVAELVAAGMPRKRAAELVAGIAGVSARALYRSSL